MRGVVFSAGGVCGLQMLGGLESIQREGADEISVFGGTSAGAIVAFVGALKTVRAHEVLNYIIDHPPHKLRSLNINNLLTRFGLDDGEKLFSYLATMFESLAAGSSQLTFRQLRARTGNVLRVTAVCTTTSSLDVFDCERSPDCVVMDAIRASCCIPLYFTPHRIGGRLYVDGGLLAYYPHSLLDDVPEEQRLAVFVGVTDAGPESTGGGFDDLAAHVYKLSRIACTAKELEAISEVGWILVLSPDARCGGKLSLHPDPGPLRAAFSEAREATSVFIHERWGIPKTKRE